jgi:hypothetical protein
VEAHHSAPDISESQCRSQLYEVQFGSTDWLFVCRYGAVPVVRRTGGLADTVRDVEGHKPGEGNGYTFDGKREGGLMGNGKGIEGEFCSWQGWGEGGCAAPAMSSKVALDSFSWLSCSGGPLKPHAYPA